MSNTAQLNNCPKCGAPIPAGAPDGLCPKCVLIGAAAPTDTGIPATATSEIPSVERVATAFPQLEIVELIGRGGMGFVFKARQPHLDRFVALKLLPDKLARDPRFAERFNREGRVLARLNHPNIVSVYDFGRTEHFYFLLMEFVDGVNLRQAMQAGRFSPGEALGIVPKICEALQYAHEQGILHRDIKPENLLLDARGQVKIADFGIAKLVGEDKPDIALTATGAALGTAHYMAPEQLEKPTEVDHRADIYSLGVVFYEMLTGELPIGRFAAPSSKTPVGTNVDEVVFRTLEKDRERRYQSAGEMKTQVEHLGAGEPCPIGATPGAAGQVGPHGTLVVVPAAPAWVNPAAFAFLGLAGVAAAVTLRSMAASKFEVNLLMLIGLTGLALLTRSAVCRRVALVVNRLGLLLPWISVYQVAAAMQNGTLPVGWKPTFAGLPNSAGLAVLFALLETAAWGSALWALLRRDVRPLFRATPRPRLQISEWALWGALMVGLSLPAPLFVVLSILAGGGGAGRVEMLLALGSVALPGLGGTLLGWLGLNEIRESGGKVRGLPLAMFASMTWPLTILGGVVIGLPMFIAVPASESTIASMLGRVLVLLLPAGVITLGFWAVQATARWAGRQPPGQRRGILKWVFIVLLLAGIGVVLVVGEGRRVTMRYASGPAIDPQASRSRASFRPGEILAYQWLKSPEATSTTNTIRFTITNIELRAEDGRQWLAMDYATDVRGDCEEVFQVNGKGLATRKSGLLVTPADSPPVQRQRFEWQIPTGADPPAVKELSDEFARALVGKSFVIPAGEQRPLFRLPIGMVGDVSVAIGTRLRDPSP